MKKTLSLILTLALALSAFTACSGDSTETNAPATDASTEASKETTADTIGETEAATEAVTEAETEAVTEAETEAATEAETEAPSTEPSTYDEILSAANIVHTPHFMVVGEVEFTSFVKNDDELGIICDDYAHEGDIIKGWKETLYMPIEEGATEEEITMMSQLLTSLSEEFSSLSCCKVENSTLKNMLVFSITFTNVDTDEAIAELYAAGLIDEETKLSMSETEASEISEGFIKK